MHLAKMTKAKTWKPTDTRVNSISVRTNSKLRQL